MNISKPLEQEFLQLLNPCVLFGSRAWGVATNTSDYDYILNAQQADAIENFLHANNVDCERSGRYGAELNNDRKISVNINGTKYDLVIFFVSSTEDHRAAVQATTIMTKFAEQTNINDKRFRIQTFEAFLNLASNGKLPSSSYAANFAVTNFPELLI